MPLVNYSFTALIDTDSGGDNIVASQAVAVRVESDATYATIYSDSAGASPITQPGAATDSNGVLEFYVLPGYYTITSGTRTETVLIDDGSRLNPSTTADMAASKHIKVGEKGIKTAEFSTGNGGGGTYDCVTVGTTAGVDKPNADNIIVSTVDATKCFKQRLDLVTETFEAKTIYVDPLLGSDTTHNGTAVGVDAFLTIQYAYDSIPPIVKHEQTIQLADGTYNANYLDSATSVALPRPAILFGRGKTITARTQKNGNILNGGLVIKGNLTTPANVVIEPNDTYSYGIYNGQGQLGIQGLHIRPAVGSTAINNLLTSHRMDSYVHAVDVTIDGRDKAVTQFGLLTESGGQMEFTTSNLSVEIKNCANLAKALTPGDNLNIAGDVTMSVADNGLFATSMGRVNFNAATITGQTISSCSNFAAIATDGGQISMRGADDSNHITIDGDVSLETNSTLTMVWTDITGETTSENSVISLNNSDYQGQITVDGGSIAFDGSDSFISPATANDSTIPVLLKNGATKAEAGTNNFNGSGGLSLHAQTVTEQTVGSDATTISIPDELAAVVRLNTSATRINCVLPAGVYQWQTVEIFCFAGFSVQLIESTTATIATNSIKLSGLSAADEYMGIKFIWRGTQWYEISRSRAGA